MLEQDKLLSSFMDLQTNARWWQTLSSYGVKLNTLSKFQVSFCPPLSLSLPLSMSLSLSLPLSMSLCTNCAAMYCTVLCYYMYDFS